MLETSFHPFWRAEISVIGRAFHFKKEYQKPTLSVSMVAPKAIPKAEANVPIVVAKQHKQQRHKKEQENKTRMTAFGAENIFFSLMTDFIGGKK
jgi:mannitol-specific phosphotransferase system IIBC component